mmetsp:Transcript_41914/g.109147  ORF Transcript_41914/g.109147 Transcript_41914/m.109147 type:complete len:200 (+) Transcript_41914:404-1003(+)
MGVSSAPPARQAAESAPAAEVSPSSAGRVHALASGAAPAIALSADAATGSVLRCVGGCRAEMATALWVAESPRYSFVATSRSTPPRMRIQTPMTMRGYSFKKLDRDGSAYVLPNSILLPRWHAHRKYRLGFISTWGADTSVYSTSKFAIKALSSTIKALASPTLLVSGEGDLATFESGSGHGFSGSFLSTGSAALYSWS